MIKQSSYIQEMFGNDATGAEFANDLDCIR